MRRALLRLIWVCTVCQCLLFGTLSINGLRSSAALAGVCWIARNHRNLDNSNTDGSFTLHVSNPLLSLRDILPTAQENIYLVNFSYFIIKEYVVFTHKNCLIEPILRSTLNNHYYIDQKDFPKLSSFAP